MSKTAYIHLYEGRVEVVVEHDNDLSAAIKFGENDDVSSFIKKLATKKETNIKMVNHRGAFCAVKGRKNDYFCLQIRERQHINN